MARFRKLTSLIACIAALALGACDSEDPMDAGGGTDAGAMDAGCPTIPPSLPTGDRPATVSCPDDPETAPAPEEFMGTCCYRNSNAATLGSPELRIAYIDIVSPVGSPLSSTIVRGVLNRAVQLETFNWLFRIEDADADGAINIVTGFGRRMTDGTYEFSQGSAGTEADPDNWCPVEIPGSIAGETISTPSIDGSITVPIFDEPGENVQAELTLVDIAIESAELGEDRSCIGWKAGRPFTYVPQALLTGYVELEPSRTQTIATPGVETTVCSALAGALSMTYCDETPRADWTIPPDALCDETGCRHNAPCSTDVCDPLTTCNAWRFAAHFAGSGVDITNDVCGG
ncbi:MAG: hypothetical protein AB8I08_04695 [Sandaracinaceae bacterium]